MNLITYNPSFFAEVFSHRVYKSQNIVALNACLKDIFDPKEEWQRISDEEEGFGEPKKEKSVLPLITANETAMTYLLNRMNSVLLHVSRGGVREITTGDGDVITTAQLDFLQNHLANKDGFEKEFKRFHTLVCLYAERILQPGSATYNELIGIAQLSSKGGEFENNLFVQNIHRFFPHPIDIRTAENTAIFNYRGRDVAVQVNYCNKMEQDGPYFKIWCEYDPLDPMDEEYIAFILPNNYIYLFQKDRSKIRNMTGQEILNTTGDAGVTFLFHKDILVDYKKVF